MGLVLVGHVLRGLLARALVVLALEAHAALVLVDLLVPVRVDERDLLPAVEDGAADLAVDAVGVEEERVVGLQFVLELREVGEELVAQELAVGG